MKNKSTEMIKLLLKYIMEKYKKEMEVKENVLKVNSFNDVEDIAKNLKEENSIIIEVAGYDSRDRVRIIDFVAGLVCYNGKLKKLEANKFLVVLDKNQRSVLYYKNNIRSNTK